MPTSEATTYSFNMDIYQQLFAQLGHLGLPSMCLPRTSIQHLFVMLAGVTNTIYLLADYPDTVEAYFKALSKSQEGMLEAVSNIPWSGSITVITCTVKFSRPICTGNTSCPNTKSAETFFTNMINSSFPTGTGTSRTFCSLRESAGSTASKPSPPCHRAT